jgi:beta-phosphoglucomutase-like phosphatase (HAD superfamily)
MKPDPEPIWHAVRLLNADPRTAVLVGDSLTDIAAARAVQMPIIAYANKPHKVAPFVEAEADAVVTSMIEIARALIPPASVDQEITDHPRDNSVGHPDAEVT